MPTILHVAFSTLFQRARMTPIGRDAARRRDVAREIYEFIRSSPDELHPFEHFARHFSSPERVLESLDYYRVNGSKEIAVFRIGSEIACIAGLGYDHVRRLAEIAIYKHPMFKGKCRGVTVLAKRWVARRCRELGYMPVVSTISADAERALEKIGYCLRRLPREIDPFGDYREVCPCGM